MQAEAPRSETNFRSLLAELDAMEQGLKSDFDDLPLAPLEDEGGDVVVARQAEDELQAD
ncbi:hypothetical protein D3C75_696720 [compost metagenome]